ncbi:MAG: AMP-binding protein, partial [Planctomycetaceae bacterium]
MNIGTLLTNSALSFPDNLAIVHGADTWTYAEFNERANRFADGLRQLGVGKSEHVALLMHNSPQMLEA